MTIELTGADYEAIRKIVIEAGGPRDEHHAMAIHYALADHFIRVGMERAAKICHGVTGGENHYGAEECEKQIREAAQ